MTATIATTEVAAYRTLILLEVLSSEPLAEMELADIAHAVTEGDCSGHILSTNSIEIDRPTAEYLLQEQGSDPQFLFGHLDDAEPDSPSAPIAPAPGAPWSITNPVPDYGEECVVLLANGGQLRCPPFPSECDYVRVIDGEGVESGYWNVDELKESPAEVLGAILGAANASA